MVDFFETEEPLNEMQIEKLEGKLKFNLPFEYKHHLQQFNGGRCEPNIFSFKENSKLTQSSLD